MHHKLKIDKQWADEITDGNKNFEIRNNDRGFQKGDTVSFVVNPEYKDVECRPYDPQKTIAEKAPKQSIHIINTYTFEITFVLSGFHIDPGYVVFAMRRVKQL